MSNKIFAFSISKPVEENTVPDASLVYDSIEQANIWKGDSEIMAGWYCTTATATYKCAVINQYECSGSTGTSGKKCDIF